MRMKHILVVTLCACLSACSVKNDDANCPPAPSPDLMEVIVHEYSSFDFGQGNLIAGTLPDGTQSRILLFTRSGSILPVFPRWPSIGSDGTSLLITDGQGMYIHSLATSRITFQIVNAQGYFSYGTSKPYFSQNMREILGTDLEGATLFSVNRSTGLTSNIFGPAECHTKTGDDRHFVFIESRQVFPDFHHLLTSTDAAGRNRKVLREYDVFNGSQLIWLAAIPSSGSREFIYLQQTNGEYRFVKTDVDLSYEIIMDIIPIDEMDPQTIYMFTTNENGDKIAYFSARDLANPFGITVRNYSNNQLTGVTRIPMPSALEMTMPLSEFRAQLCKIDREIWNRLPQL